MLGNVDSAWQTNLPKITPEGRVLRNNRGTKLAQEPGTLHSSNLSTGMTSLSNVQLMNHGRLSNEQKSIEQ